MNIEITFWAAILSTLGFAGSVVVGAWWLGAKIGALTARLDTVIERTAEQAAAIKDLYERKVEKDVCDQLRETH